MGGVSEEVVDGASSWRYEETNANENPCFTMEKNQ